MDDFLKDKLSELDIKNGFGGEYSFYIEVVQPESDSLLIGVSNLTEQAARILFDQFDEHNSIGRPILHKFKISLLKSGKEIDYNYLPNCFTV